MLEQPLCRRKLLSILLTLLLVLTGCATTQTPETTVESVEKQNTKKYNARVQKDIIDFKGELVFNADKPDGTMKKLTNVSKLNSLALISAQ